MPSTSSQLFLKELDKKLWTAADRLRASLDAAVYKHVVLGLIFLKYVSDSFAMRQSEIGKQLREPKNEYFLGQFAVAEGKKGGQYFTLKFIVSLIVEMIEPYHGRVYDLACPDSARLETLLTKATKGVSVYGRQPT